MTDIKDPRLLWTKAGLFAFLGVPRRNENQPDELSVDKNRADSLAVRNGFKRWIIRITVVGLIGNVFVPPIVVTTVPYAIYNGINYFDYTACALLGVLCAEAAVACFLGAAVQFPLKYRMPIAFGACFAIAASLTLGAILAGGLDNQIVPMLFVSAFLVPILGVSLLFLGIRVLRQSTLQINADETSTFNGTAPEQVSLRYVFAAMTGLALVLAVARGVETFFPFIQDTEFWGIVPMGVVMLLFAAFVTVLVAECVLRDLRSDIAFVHLLTLLIAIYFFPHLFGFLFNAQIGIQGDNSWMPFNRTYFAGFAVSLAIFLWPLRLVGGRLRFIQAERSRFSGATENIR